MTTSPLTSDLSLSLPPPLPSLTPLHRIALAFIETSALENNNVELAFQQILTDIYHTVSKAREWEALSHRVPPPVV